MDIQLDTAVLDRLTSCGVLAYVAVKMAEGSEATTAALAGLVKTRTGIMLEGLKELSVEMPGLVEKKKSKSQKWCCGEIKAGDGVVVQSLDSERYRLFVDDLKKYWDYLNPDLAFEMGGKDGSQIRIFLRDHRGWVQETWLTALRYRAISIVKYGHATRTEPLWTWVGYLAEYVAGPKNQFNKPVEGSGKHGEASVTRDRNREAVERAIANA